jgi:hypothetical protein
MNSRMIAALLAAGHLVAAPNRPAPPQIVGAWKDPLTLMRRKRRTNRCHARTTRSAMAKASRKRNRP